MAIDDLMNPNASCRTAERGDPPENVGAQFLEFAGETHDVHQRRAQIVADDIGEALDFVVGLAKIGRALVDRGLEIEVIVAQHGFGVVPRARRTPHQKDRDAGQHDNKARADAGHRCRQALTAVGARGALGKQTIFFRAHLAGQIVDVLHGVVADILPHDPGGVVDVLRPRKFDGVAEFLDSLIDQRKHLVSEALLNGIVADKLAQPCLGWRELGRGLLKIGLKIRQQRRKIAALRAFGATQLQLNQRQLVFHFNGADNPARVLARPVHQMDRTGADDRQHHEARRKQDDLPNRAPTRCLRRHNNLAS